MRTIITTIIAVGTLLLFAQAAQAEDTIRCKNALVRVGMSESEVIARCGEPRHKDVESVPVRAGRRNGGSQIIGTTQIERWTYDRGAGQFPALLTFEEGELKSIELITRP